MIKGSESFLGSLFFDVKPQGKRAKVRFIYYAGEYGTSSVATVLFVKYFCFSKLY